MVEVGESFCPICGGELKYFDKVPRIVRTKYRHTEWNEIRRLKCSKCGVLHRELPDNIYIYKQYEADIIDGVI